MSASWCPSLIIDQEFKSWIPPLTQIEREALEESITKDGCRDPIVIWDETIIDGHNRYEICTRLKIYFKVSNKQFTSREEAKNWIINNQLGRRNITPEQRKYLLGRLYLEQKKVGGAPEGNSNAKKQLDQNDPVVSQPVSTAQKIAEQFKTSEPTVKRAAIFAQAVDTIATNCGPEVKDKILTRDIDVTQEDVQQLAKKPPEQQKAIIEQITSGVVPTIRKATAAVSRQIQREKVWGIAAKNAPIDGRLGRFNLVLADPPWEYNDRCQHSDSRFGGGVTGQYPTMPVEEICALKVMEIVAEDSMLFLWCTWPHLENAKLVIEAWGFKYKTCAFDWMKLNPSGKGLFHGTGYYTKSNTEYCLLATRGEVMKPAVDTESMAILAPIREHSEKPEESYQRIERMYPSLRKIELFARKPRQGWMVWGNQSDGSLFND